MTFHQFNPSSDTLEVGTEIRIAGREGEITMTDEEHPSHKHLVEWHDSGYMVWLNLYAFTFEIADKPAKPLTIDKRVKEGVMKAYHQWADDSEERLDNVIAYLNSLEEV